MSPSPLDPLYAFRFVVSFEPSAKPQGAADGGGDQGSSGDWPDGAFAECTGLEATMEPKVIKAGGSNYGAFQRVGQVTFGTVILKRGISRQGKLFQWFERVTQGDPGHRCTVTIALLAPPASGQPSQGQAGGREAALSWVLARALPIKFKAADFNARATDVGIEELHLAHEGLSFKKGRPQ